MASRGFVFAYNLDGDGLQPMVTDLTEGDGTAYAKGDVVTIQSDGYADKQTASVGEVTGIVAESITSAEASAGVTSIKVAIVTPQQVWKCSMDDSSTSAVVGYTKTLDIADTNTIDANDITDGTLIAFNVSKTDDEGNILAYVTFHSTTFARGTVDTDTT